MKRLLITIFLIIGAASANASIIYNVDRTVGSATVMGTITTDGTIGVIDDVNITDFSLFLNDGTYSLTISQANGGTHIVSTGLTATSNELLFNFNSTGYAHFQLDPVDTGTPFWCLTGSNSTSHCSSFLGYEVVKTSQNPIVFHSVRNSGTLAVANVPEPATLVLLGLGIAGIGYSRRQLKKA